MACNKQEMTLESRLQQYLRSNYNKDSLKDSLNYDTIANDLITVAKKYDLEHNTQRQDEEYHNIVKGAIDNFLTTDAANDQGQDKAHNLGKGQNPDERFQNIVSSVNVKYL